MLVPYILKDNIYEIRTKLGGQIQKEVLNFKERQQTNPEGCECSEQGKQYKIPVGVHSTSELYNVNHSPMSESPEKTEGSLNSK